MERITSSQSLWTFALACIFFFSNFSSRVSRGPEESGLFGMERDVLVCEAGEVGVLWGLGAGVGRGVLVRKIGERVALVGLGAGVGGFGATF